MERDREHDVHDPPPINAGTLGQGGWVPGLRLSADQIGHFHEPARWQPGWSSLIPESRRAQVVLAVIVAAVAAGVVWFALELFQLV